MNKATSLISTATIVWSCSSNAMTITQFRLEIKTRIEDMFQRKVAVNYSSISGLIAITGFVNPRSVEFFDLTVIVLVMYLGKHRPGRNQNSIQINLFAVKGTMTFQVGKEGQREEFWLNWNLKLFDGKQYGNRVKFADYLP